MWNNFKKILPLVIGGAFFIGGIKYIGLTSNYPSHKSYQFVTKRKDLPVVTQNVKPPTVNNSPEDEK